MSKLRLEGKVAIITGAASGIGEATARLFAENGALIVISDIQDDLGQAVATSIGLDKSCYRRCDVRDEKQVQETVAYTLEKYGRIDVLFSNAGIMGPPTSILDMDLGALDNTMAINLRGAAAMLKHVARSMVEGKIRGSIICTASVVATVGGVGPHDYTTSKSALLGLVRSAASELGKDGIRVNAVSPHGVATPLACGPYGLDPSEMEAICSSTSNLKGVVLKARHVAEAVLFLASDESLFISGHNLAVDGGISVVSTGFSLYK